MAMQKTAPDKFDKALTFVMVGIFAVAVLAFLALIFGMIMFAPMKAV